MEVFVPQVVGAKTAQAAWDKLASTYASGSKAHICTIKSKLYHLTKESAESIGQYTQCAKSMFDQLIAFNSAVPETILCKLSSMV